MLDTITIVAGVCGTALGLAIANAIKPKSSAVQREGPTLPVDDVR